MKINNKQINFRQHKYMLPAILYIPISVASYFIIDLFSAGVSDSPASGLQTTEYLNYDIPEATIRGGDGIGSKYENMNKSWGKIGDYTAIDNIEREDPEDALEEYESRYTEEDVALIKKETEKDVPEYSETGEEEETLAELEKVLAEARLKGAQMVTPEREQQADTMPDLSSVPVIDVKGVIEADSKAVTEISDDESSSKVVKKIKKESDFFHTLSSDGPEEKLITAIIDENLKAVDGSRIRLRLLDDIEIDDRVVRRGTYLYAILSGFSSQRVKGTINSILVGDELVKVNLSLYDTDGLEGLYIPFSQFRETGKDVAGGAISGNMAMNTGTAGNNLAQWGMNAIQNAYQKTTSAIGKSIKKNKAKIKYGTFVYIINAKDVK